MSSIGGIALAVGVGNLDGDGDLDLAVANVGSDDTSVLLSNGDGTFAAEVRYGAGSRPVSVAGSVEEAWLVNERPQASPPATIAATTQPTAVPTTQPSIAHAGPTTRPALMEPVQGVTLTGLAICGNCFLDIGPLTRHPVVPETSQPYRTFLLAQNDRLEEVEAITESCGAGDIDPTTTGDVLVVNGQNVFVVRSFTHRALEADTAG